MRRDLFERLKRLEDKAGKGMRCGLAMLETLVVVDGCWGDRDVIAIEVGERGQPRVMIDRLPGETLDALEARANPSGTWRAFPSPVFAAEERPYEERLMDRDPLRPGEWLPPLQGVAQ